MVTFSGKKLREVRKSRGISQALLAEKADSSIRYIRSLEVGEKSNPSVKLIYLVSIALAIPMEDLLEVEEDAW